LPLGEIVTRISRTIGLDWSWQRRAVAPWADAAAKAKRPDALQPVDLNPDAKLGSRTEVPAPDMAVPGTGQP
jgi:hypothetical protein